MKKSHREYLRRAIGKAIAENNIADLTDSVLRIKAPDTDMYQMVRDIVCDARFYSVIDNDAFWKTYGTYRIGKFVDSIPAEQWQHQESLTMLKEDFLNEWMADHMMPLSTERRRKIEADIRIKMLDEDAPGLPDPGDHDGSSLGELRLGVGIRDSTNRTGVPAEGLPPLLKEYMGDSGGGNSPGFETDGHKAEARFLSRIHPSIRRLAEMIGRRGASESMRPGKFRNASKSDISGVTVGDDLGALLPSEVALLATPESEKVFLDRFTRKRLQMFSSASRPSEARKDKHGPIFICIDTSGSMTGEPEEMAKTLSLAIAITAQKESRPVCIFNYSFDISFFVLKSLRRQRMKLLRFLSDSYGGGNDENRLIDLIFSRMPKLPRYKDFTTELTGADMLVVSDFQWIGLNPEKTAQLSKARKSGMRIFSVGVNLPDSLSLRHNIEDEEEGPGYLSGFRFFSSSDFSFRFEGEMVKEQ